MPQLYILSKYILCTNCMHVLSYYNGANLLKLYSCYRAPGLNTGQDVHKIASLRLVYENSQYHIVVVELLKFLGFPVLGSSFSCFLPQLKLGLRLDGRLAACLRHHHVFQLVHARICSSAQLTIKWGRTGVHGWDEYRQYDAHWQF